MNSRTACLLRAKDACSGGIFNSMTRVKKQLAGNDFQREGTTVAFADSEVDFHPFSILIPIKLLYRSNSLTENMKSLY